MERRHAFAWSSEVLSLLVVQLVNPMLLFQYGARRSWGAAGTARNFMGCSSLASQCCDPCQRSEPDADLVRICLAVALVLQRNLKSSGSMRADSGKGPCQLLRITLLLSLCTEASPCVEMDNIHNSAQPSESVSLAVTVPRWACP